MTAQLIVVPARETQGPMLLSELAAMYANRKLITADRQTIDKYRTAIGHLTRTLGRTPTVDDLTDDIVGLMIGRLVQAGRSIPTVNMYRSKLLALWRFAARRKIVGEWPESEKLPEPQRAPVAWTEGQLRTLFAAVKKETGYIGPVHAGDWWTALHMLLWDSGERITAMLSLRWDDVDEVAGWATLRAEFRKGRRSDRVFKLHARTAVMLVGIRKPDRELVLEWPGSRHSLWNRYRGILRRAGLPHDRQRMFHCMRRSVASHAERLGGNATELLDHSSRQITVESYISPTIAPRPQAADILPRPDAEPEGGAA